MTEHIQLLLLFLVHLQCCTGGSCSTVEAILVVTNWFKFINRRLPLFTKYSILIFLRILGKDTHVCYECMFEFIVIEDPSITGELSVVAPLSPGSLFLKLLSLLL